MGEKKKIKKLPVTLCFFMESRARSPKEMGREELCHEPLGDRSLQLCRECWPASSENHLSGDWVLCWAPAVTGRWDSSSWALGVGLEQTEVQKNPKAAEGWAGTANLRRVSLSIPQNSSLGSASHTWEGDFFPSPSFLPHTPQSRDTKGGSSVWWEEKALLLLWWHTKDLLLWLLLSFAS